MLGHCYNLAIATERKFRSPHFYDQSYATDTTPSTGEEAAAISSGRRRSISVRHRLLSPRSVDVMELGPNDIYAHFDPTASRSTDKQAVK